jgi:beta-galactosidase/beta-glucuronidase
VLQDDKEVATFPAREKYSYYDIHVANPQLWWPNGIGKPHIYDFTVQLLALGSGEVIDQRKIPFGIRTV